MTTSRTDVRHDQRHAQQWASFGLTAPALASGQTLGSTRPGIEVRLDEHRVRSLLERPTPSRRRLSWNNGGELDDRPRHEPNRTANLTTSNQTATLGQQLVVLDLAGPHAGSRGDITDTNFRVRLTADKGCGDLRHPPARSTMLEVRATYSDRHDDHDGAGQTTTTNLADQNLQGPGTACTTGVAELLRGRRRDAQPARLLGRP